jgi:hypothetical protein
MSLPRPHLDYLNWMIGKTIVITRGPREGQQAKVKEIEPIRDSWALECFNERGARFLVYPMDFAFAKEAA